MEIIVFLLVVITGVFTWAFCRTSGDADKRAKELNMKAGEKDGKEQQADKPIQSNVQADSEHHT